MDIIRGYLRSEGLSRIVPVIVLQFKIERFRIMFGELVEQIDAAQIQQFTNLHNVRRQSILGIIWIF
jgi:hypothetical protein